MFQARASPCCFDRSDGPCGCTGLSVFHSGESSVSPVGSVGTVASISTVAPISTMLSSSVAQEAAVVLLLATTGAAMLGALGAAPLLHGGERPRLVGLAEASAAGFMLGVSHLLLTVGLGEHEFNTVLGAGAGVVYTLLVKWYAGTSEFEAPDDLALSEAAEPTIVRELLQSALHSAAEGIAIGVGFIIEPRLGLLLALVLGLHNIGEGVAIADVLVRAGVPRRQAAGLCVVAKMPQVLFALATFAMSPVLARLPALASGFAAGALAFLVLTELLPDAYRKAPKLGIAGLATITAAVVVLLEGSLV